MRWIALLWSVELILFVAAFWKWQLQSWQVVSHVLLVAVLSLAVMSATACLCRAVRSRLWRDVVGGVLLGTYFNAVVAFHFTVVAALNSWGQLPTVDLVAAYLRELPHLQNALGISPLIVWLCVFVAWAGLSALHAMLMRAVKRPKDSFALSMWGSAARLPVLVLGMFAFGVVPVAFVAYVTNVDAAALSEPLYVALNGDVWQKSQTNPTTRLRIQQLQQTDDLARKTYVPATTPERRNIILITVDALRPDHMSLYGYGRPTTPSLDRLAARRELAFAKVAHSPCAESFCGLLSLLTGKHGHKLAARDFGLVEVLRLHGYKRHAILGGDHAHFYGLRERYGPFDTFSDGGERSSGTSLNDDADVLARLTKLPDADDQPAFFFIHLMSAHGLGAKRTQFQKWLPAKSVYNLRVQKPDPELLMEVGNGYDNGVLQADGMIAAALSVLGRKGYLAGASIFVTGDHGDFLGEHNMFSHSRTVLEPVLHVPWIWIGHGAAALPLDHPVVHADFAPTVLRMLKMPIPEHWDGRPLQDNAPRGYSFHQQAQYAALIDYTSGGRVKYVVDRKALSASAYDLVNDPFETVDILPSVPRETVSAWRTELLKEQLIRPYSCESGTTC